MPRDACDSRSSRPCRSTERLWLYGCLPRARFRAEGAIAFASPLNEVDVGFIRDAAAMAAAVIGLGRHVRHLSRDGAVLLCHAANRRRLSSTTLPGLGLQSNWQTWPGCQRNLSDRPSHESLT